MSTPAEDQKSGNEQPSRDSGAETGEATVSKQKANCTSRREDKTCKKAFVVSIAGLVLPVALLIAWYKGNQFLVPDAGDAKTLLTLLAFVVALASYLASVAREIVKKLSDESINENDILKLRCNIAWTTTAEIQLVVLGSLIVARIFFGPAPFIPTPLISEPILLDNILWIYLGLVLLLLGGLHFRVWINERPFNIDRDSRKTDSTDNQND